MTPTPGELDPNLAPVIGMVGGGQLARMTHQAAIGLGLSLRVMAAQPGDSAAQVTPFSTIGDPRSADDLWSFASACDVITVDHELVDLDALHVIEQSGTAHTRPPADALVFATDKAHQRRRFAEAGLPLPRHHIADTPETAALAAEELGWPVVVKIARGGYDGRGVWILDDVAALDRLLDEFAEAQPILIVEEHLALQRELAVLIARSPDGQMSTYPVIETIQVDGICRETIVPARIDPDLSSHAVQIGEAAATVVGAVGVIAIELFVADGKVTVNEVATRPHNSGHWSIEGAITSQFANHLRAVADLPLGRTDAVAPAVVSANILGHADSRDPLEHLAAALAVPGASVHLYGKTPRPGRKLGHVTVLADSIDEARSRAHLAVAALGDPVPARP